ncbi:MAG: hypothetical protein Q9208_005413 [Pyrenodesmia sp. 3 TL-2023]
MPRPVHLSLPIPSTNHYANPIYSFRTQNPHQKPEQKLDHTIQYLENHNNEVRSYILAQSRAQQQRLNESSQPPPPCPPQQTQAIVSALKTPYKNGAPPPVYNPPPSGPAPTAAAAYPTVASNIKDTVAKLETFDDQARRTLAPYLAEKERLKPRGLEVPEGFGQTPALAGTTTYDQSRDPRVRR